MPSESEPQPSSVDIYVANSVLHVLYTLSLIRYKQSTNNLVLLLNEFTYAENLVAGINAEFDPASAHLLPGRFDYGAWVARQQRGEKSRFVRVIARFVSLFIQLRTKWRAGRLLRSVTGGQVYVFDDTRLDVQGVLSTIVKSNPLVKVTYIEDGVGAYHDISVSHPWKRFGIIPLRLIFGHEVVMLSTHGDHPRIGDALVLQPDFVNEALQARVVQKMPPWSLRENDIHLLRKTYGFEADEFEDIHAAVMLVVPYWRLHEKNPEIIQVFREITRSYAEQDVAVLVKYHPRDCVGDYLGLAQTPKDKIVDCGMPVELLSIQLGDRLKAVYAGLSSSMLSIGWILPAIKRNIIFTTMDRNQPKELAYSRLKDIIIADGAELYDHGRLSS